MVPARPGEALASGAVPKSHSREPTDGATVSLGMRFVYFLLMVLAVTGCGFSVGVTTLEQHQAETRYKAIYAEHTTRIHQALQELFAPTANNPGVCNVGGDKQGCYDADLKAIADFQAMLLALKAVPVPDRYVEGDRLLRNAITEDIRALELRNQAIAQSDDAVWAEHQTALNQAVELYRQAYEAFPADNRPEPPLS